MCYENIINQLKQKETKKKKRYIQNSETWGTEKIEFDFFFKYLYQRGSSCDKKKFRNYLMQNLSNMTEVERNKDLNGSAPTQQRRIAR